MKAKALPCEQRNKQPPPKNPLQYPPPPRKMSLVFNCVFNCCPSEFNLIFSDLVKAAAEERVNLVAFQHKDSETLDKYYIFQYSDAFQITPSKTAAPTRGFVFPRAHQEF